MDLAIKECVTLSVKYENHAFKNGHFTKQGIKFVYNLYIPHLIIVIFSSPVTLVNYPHSQMRRHPTLFSAVDLLPHYLALSTVMFSV